MKTIYDMTTPIKRIYITIGIICIIVLVFLVTTTYATDTEYCIKNCINNDNNEFICRTICTR